MKIESIGWYLGSSLSHQHRPEKISDEDKQVLKEAMAVCNRLLAEPPVTIPNTKTPTPIIPMESAITLTATTSLIRAGTLALDWLRQLPVSSIQKRQALSGSLK